MDPARREAAMLGEFLEISLSTRDILASLEFYEKLGFRQAPVGETWSHPYAVLTDGRLYLGLHRYSFTSPALTFVLPELRRYIGDFEERGIAFEFCKIEMDKFNEAGFLDPDGQMVTLLEARTYSPVHEAHVTPSLCGYFLEYQLPVRDRDTSARFWESLGFILTDTREEPIPYAQAAWNRINLGLHQEKRRQAPALLFAHPEPDSLAPLLEARALDVRRRGTAWVLQAPEGTELVIEAEQD